ncbi:MAG: hypothetical protein PHW11_02290 [Anaerolineaceae bacterium]|nr:hypothetical protein [Anaerolineaceae bacterium]MDD4043084.1 hypothetical protein [Anaerolineaceae bacterium]MDD4576959.1 hypothetical protein [Anaerolineaceae bacterium]
MQNNLIERYIYAVTRHLPDKEAEEVSREIDELISSMLEERADNPGSEDEKVRQVLTELGSPEALAREYTGRANDSLIGQPHYSLYLKVLKFVLMAIAIGISVAMMVSAIIEGPYPGPSDTSLWINWSVDAVVEWLTSLTSALLSGFAWVTIIFAILYHKGVKLDYDPDDLDDLPEVPQEKARIGRGELIGEAIFTTLFAILFIVMPYINIPIIGMDAKPISLFTPEVLIGVRYLLIASIVTVILEMIVKFIDKRYSLRVFGAIILTNLVSIVTVSTWLGNPEALNPVFAERFQELTGLSVYGINGQPVPGFGGHWAMLPLPFLIVIVIVVIVAIIEIISAGVKTFSSKN